MPSAKPASSSIAIGSPLRGVLLVMVATGILAYAGLAALLAGLGIVIRAETQAGKPEHP